MEATRIEDQSSKFQSLKRDVQLAVDQLGRGEGIRTGIVMRSWLNGTALTPQVTRLDLHAEVSRAPFKEFYGL